MFLKLLVGDVGRSIVFYEALGFERVGGDEVFTRLRWPKGGEIFLVATPPGVQLGGARGVGTIVCFRADEPGVTEMAGRAAAAGAPTQGPTEQPWFSLELVVTDPDGYRLAFVQPT
jgi:predicted lactoylglutathione lyase